MADQVQDNTTALEKATEAQQKVAEQLQQLTETLQHPPRWQRVLSMQLDYSENLQARQGKRPFPFPQGNMYPFTNVRHRQKHRRRLAANHGDSEN